MTFSPNSWEFLAQILLAYYMFLSTTEYKFLFNYLQLWRSYSILSAITIYMPKMRTVTLNLREWTMRHHVEGVDNAGVVKSALWNG